LRGIYAGIKHERDQKLIMDALLLWECQSLPNYKVKYLDITLGKRLNSGNVGLDECNPFKVEEGVGLKLPLK